MMADWGKYEGTDKLTKRVYKGIPDRFRGYIWTRLLNLELIKKQQKGKYEVSQMFLKIRLLN